MVNKLKEFHYQLFIIKQRQVLKSIAYDSIKLRFMGLLFFAWLFSAIDGFNVFSYIACALFIYDLFITSLEAAEVGL